MFEPRFCCRADQSLEQGSERGQVQRAGPTQVGEDEPRRVQVPVRLVERDKGRRRGEAVDREPGRQVPFEEEVPDRDRVVGVGGDVAVDAEEFDREGLACSYVSPFVPKRSGKGANLQL